MCFSDRKQLFKLLKSRYNSRLYIKKKTDIKKHKHVRKLRRRLFLQLSETQFTGLRRRQPPPEIAARWHCIHLIKKMTAHFNSQLSLLIPLGSLKTLINGSKLVAVVFKRLLFLLFIPSWSTKHLCLVDNLLCQPHLYLLPLLGFLK